jgi:hypothetical protein
MSRAFRVAVMGLVVMASVGLARDAGRAQQTTPGLPQDPAMPSAQRPGVQPPDDSAQPSGPFRGVLDEERKKAINDDRHKRLQQDVDRLLALTNELKTDVDKSSKDELSLDVIRKAGEIEKLAHDVQSRMKN